MTKPGPYQLKKVFDSLPHNLPIAKLHGHTFAKVALVTRTALDTRKRVKTENGKTYPEGITRGSIL